MHYLRASACAVLILSGCSPTSILSDVPQPYSWLPSHTSYSQFLGDNRGATLRFCFRDGRITDGILVDATPDSMAWSEPGSSVVTQCPTRQLLFVKNPSRLVPTIVGMTVCTCFFFPFGGFSSGPGGQTAPHNYWPNVAMGFAGAAVGYAIGQANPAGPEYVVETDSAFTNR